MNKFILHIKPQVADLRELGVLKRIEDIEQLDQKTPKNLFFLIDNVIQNFKTKQAFGK